VQLGVIADDVTGGTDLASTLRQAGLSVVQTMGHPSGALPPSDAVVVSLKIRTAPADEAVSAASRAAEALHAAGASQIYFKYCSTFDSTDHGNIGPVTDRLLDDLGGEFTVSTPAYPSLGRTVYLGHLFVNATLLGESPMRDHPLTPMTDSNLVRVLTRQSRLHVGLIDLPTVEAGAVRIRDACHARVASGQRVFVADAVSDRHLDSLGEACRTLPFVTGAAGLGRSLARQMTSRFADPLAECVPDPRGRAVVLSGSCSAATQAQVRQAADHLETRAMDPAALAADPESLAQIVDWVTETARRADLMVYSTASPDLVRHAQQQLGQKAAAETVESAFRTLARALAQAGVRTFIVAGGETSGAVMDALGIRVVGFGQEIEPGVPWTTSVDPPGYRLALKSGNFGSPDFFLRAIGGHRD
jgi:3-dehydrotetronate 4-kinase